MVKKTGKVYSPSIKSKNGAENIDVSRQATNKSNLDDAINEWKFIVQMTNYNSKIPKNIKTWIDTISNRIKKNRDFHEIISPSDNEFHSVKKMAQVYLAADPWLQISFCKDSTRQSVDEQVQRAMLDKYVENGNFAKEKSGLYVYNGNFYNKKDLKKELGPTLDRKDIDTCGKVQNNEIKIFQKYAKVAGGHQDNVVIEALNFVKDCNEYVNKHNDNYFFAAQLDGAYIESHIPSLKQEIQNPNKVCVGNSESVIDWINQL